MPSQVNIGTGSVSAARRLLLMFSPCWSYQALSHDWAPNCCRSKTFFKMRTAAGCAEAQASLEVHGSIKHCSLFLKSLFSGLGGGSPKMYAASPTPPGEACLPERDFGSLWDQGAQNCQGTAEPFCSHCCPVSVPVCVLVWCLLTAGRGACGNLWVQMKPVRVQWMEEQGHPTISNHWI